MGCNVDPKTRPLGSPRLGIASLTKASDYRYIANRERENSSNVCTAAAAAAAVKVNSISFVTPSSAGLRSLPPSGVRCTLRKA